MYIYIYIYMYIYDRFVRLVHLQQHRNGQTSTRQHKDERTGIKLARWDRRTSPPRPPERRQQQTDVN